MRLLAELVRASSQVAATSSRLAKTAAIAEFLKSLDSDEAEIAIPYLSGDIRQGRLTLGFSALQAARQPPASAPTLGLRDVDRTFAELKRVKGKRAAAQRETLLKNMFSKATAQEQDFLVRLIVGELRQGALEGVMLEAVAAATGLPA